MPPGLHMRWMLVVFSLWYGGMPALAQDPSPPTESIMVEDPEGLADDADDAEDVPPAPDKKTPDDKKPAQAAIAKDKESVPEPEPQSVYTNGIVLQGLNKVTARIQKLDGPMGTVLRFGNLEIIPRRCWKSSPEAQPENAALLEIWELKPGEGPQRIFLGWMFASSPGLSSLQHPVYDISVIACEERKPDAD